MPRKKKEQVSVLTGSEEGADHIFDSHGDVPRDMVDGLASAGPVEINKVANPPADTITIRLDSQGRIDLAGMRPKTAAKLTAAIDKTPEVLPGQGKVSSESVPDFLVALPHQLIASLEITFAARQIPAEIAQKIFGYTKEDHEILAGPTKAVLAEYMPMLGRHQNLAALVGALFVVHSQKIALMRSYLETATPKAA